MNKPSIKEGLVTIEMVVLAIYNAPSAFIKETYGLSEAKGDYFESKMSSAINNFGRWWGSLDIRCRIRAIESASKLYGNESIERIESYIKE